jgi:hypothetical protein
MHRRKELLDVPERKKWSWIRSGLGSVISYNTASMDGDAISVHSLDEENLKTFLLTSIGISWKHHILKGVRITGKQW